MNTERKDMPYLVGRLIAITEHYASKHFGPGTLREMYKFPARYIDVFSKYVDNDDEFYKDVTSSMEEPIPTVAKITDKADMAMGYYAQKSLYDGEKAKESDRLRIGQRIAALRIERGMTQQDLADKTGLIRAHISRIEMGKYSVGLDALQTIADALDCDVEICERVYKMEDLANYINKADEWPTDVEDIIERNGWVSDCGTEFGVCHDGKNKVVMDDNGQAKVINNG